MAPSDALSAYSDASSSYWPPGWDFARFARATPDDNASLSDDERAKMQAGLRDVLGEDGVGELARLMWQEELRVMREARKNKKQQQSQDPPAINAPKVTLRPPEWLKSSRQYYRGQPWGFVAFYISVDVDGDGDESAQKSKRDKFQDAVQKIIETPFNTAIDEGHPPAEVNEARSNFEIKWIEVAASAAANNKSDSSATGGGDDNDDSDTAMLVHLRSRYRDLRGNADDEKEKLPVGLDQPLFLAANASSVASVLAESSESTTSGKYWRPDAPFLLAVAAEDELGPVDDANDNDDAVSGPREAGTNSQPDRHKPVFKVAAEVLVGELWPTVDRQITSMETLTRYVQKARLMKNGDGTETSFATGGAEEEEERLAGDDLDEIWWSVHAPPRHMRKRRRI